MAIKHFSKKVLHALCKKVLDDSTLQFSIDGSILPVVNSCVDLGITVSNDMSPRLHINNMVAKAHKRANAIHRCFISKDISTLVRAFIVYVRPMVEYNSSLWSPHFQGRLHQPILSTYLVKYHLNLSGT